jgi:nucleotide-binding universal stress UspA family protein
MDMFKNILVCLDGSKLAEQILPYIEIQALQFNSKVTLFQVVSLPASNVVAAGATYTDEPKRSEQTLIDISNASVYLETLSHSLQKKGIKLEVMVIKAPQVGKAIIEYAKKNHIDLIGIVTHGHGGLGRLVFGSVFEYVLRESGIPMLVIKPQKT